MQCGYGCGTEMRLSSNKSNKRSNTGKTLLFRRRVAVAMVDGEGRPSLV